MMPIDYAQGKDSRGRQCGTRELLKVPLFCKFAVSSESGGLMILVHMRKPSSCLELSGIRVFDLKISELLAFRNIYDLLLINNEQIM